MSNLADELDRDDLDALADWLEARRKTKTERKAQDDLREKIDALASRGLSDEDVERIAAAVTRQANAAPGDGGGEGAGADGQGTGGDGSGGGSATPDPKPKKKAKRPGRKSGQVYDFDVDDNGRPVKLDVARVYSGEDEPDEVEYDDGEDD